MKAHSINTHLGIVRLSKQHGALDIGQTIPGSSRFPMLAAKSRDRSSTGATNQRMASMSRLVAFAAVVTLTMLASTAANGESYVLFPHPLKTAAGQIKKAIEAMAFIEQTMKEVVDGKDPPAREQSWNEVVFSAEKVADLVEDAQLISHQPGDMSAASQQDCTKYEAVLANARIHYRDLQETEPAVPPIIEHLSTMNSDLKSGAKSAVDLSERFAYMSNSPVPVIRDYFAWASYDLLKVSNAMNKARGAVDGKLTKLQKYYGQLPDKIKEWGIALEQLEARMPAMRDYCSRH